MIRVKASVSIRLPSGKFPQGSFVAVLEPARADLQRDVERAFADKRDPQTGKAWPERKHLYPWPMLVKSGRMRERALTAAANATVNGATITMAIRSPKYSQWHMTGTRYMAKRRFFGSSIATRAALLRRLKGAGVRVFSTVTTPAVRSR